ncbi:hypothetical protein JQ615_23845 [Bradyrhizobium jicamae]|uniref:DUF1508 domain-containing protein n=1 Tax=Bradyrhizobium jicamae TaxID=280332 RepID=A0ABS5FNP5_9BRAD|nr:hypothetical protein [Bradyrhizobium jicamae]MBR0798424.1 hypothetical protein [Bradyrhizobium jicamae]MBR0936342.1 hypothetical protein [Bradyrhizobium jicamae]
MIYGGFEIKSFEAGKGQWHARIQRTDQRPVVIDGISFPTLDIGFAWSDRDAAIADAKLLIDRFPQRYGVTMPSATASA